MRWEQGTASRKKSTDAAGMRPYCKQRNEKSVLRALGTAGQPRLPRRGPCDPAIAGLQAPARDAAVTWRGPR